MDALDTLITMAQEFDTDIDPETKQLGDEAAAGLAAYKAFVAAYDKWAADDSGYFGEPFEEMCAAREALTG